MIFVAGTGMLWRRNRPCVFDLDGKGKGRPSAGRMSLKGLSFLDAHRIPLLALLPEWALLRWGAVMPEEHYLEAKFGTTYTDYAGRVRRWL